MDFIIPYIASQKLNATGVQIGLIFSVQVIGIMISSLFVGFMTDKVKSRRKLILLGSFGRGTAYFILFTGIILKSLIGIGIGTFSIGFFAGFFWIPFNTLIAEKSNKDHRSHAYGKRDSAVGRGMLIGSIFGFTIFALSIGNTDNPFIIYSAILLFGIANFSAGILFLRKVDETIKFSNETNIQHENETNSTENTNRNRLMFLGLIFLSIVLLLASINGSLGRPFLNVYLLEAVVSDPIIATFAYLPSGIISMIIAPKLGEVADKIKPSIGILIFNTFGAILTWFLINTDNVIIFAIILVFDMAIINTAHLIFQNLVSRITSKHRGKIFGFFQFFGNVGATIGPILGGIVLDSIGLKAPFLISIVVELCLIPFYIILVRIIKPHLREKYDEKVKI
ncbi:Multidrug resistance protein MdtG [subsurface metagenome]